MPDYDAVNVTGVNGTVRVDYKANGKARIAVANSRAGKWPSDWWHAGYLEVKRAGTDATFVSLGASFTTTPLKSGCRIPSGLPLTVSFDRSVDTTVSTPSGLSLKIPAGVWPDNVEATVTISQLMMSASSPPTGATEAGPTAFFEPSGISFRPPGVTMSMVVNSASQVMLGQELQVFRLSDGAWVPLPSVTQDRTLPRLVDAVSTTVTIPTEERTTP